MTHTKEPGQKLQQSIDFFNERVNDAAVALGGELRKIIPKALKARSISGFQVDDEVVSEVARFAARDLMRLVIYQEDNVNSTKVYSYLCFWVRKLKPVTNAYWPNKQSMHDVNERLSLWLLSSTSTAHLLQNLGQDNPTTVSVAQRFKNFLDSGELFEYTVHCMRRRTFGPHHYSILARMLLET